ncbi:outer membrane beta-barrel protein [Aerolutibacter daejeonensis]|uniref:outer membrane beta-barrel protein n=1 Tax=Aerolutibacter daejeonensis TaxID=346181 RepID=UPI00068AB169|nr:outer membrane beta-barrel protein [Lysobacter daejeonensis]
MNKMLASSAVLAFAALSAPAFAADDAHGFVRAELGTTYLTLEGEEGDDNSYSLRGGYFFNKNIGVEGFYTSYGSDAENGVSVDVDGIGLGVVGKTHFGTDADTGFFLQGRAGAVRVNTDFAVSGLGRASEKKTKPYIGVGAGYDFTPAFGLSLNYDYTKPNAFDTDMKLETFTFGGEFRF